MLRLAGCVRTIFCKLIFGQRGRSGYQITRKHALGSACTYTMLHARHLPWMPAIQKVTEDATVSAQFTVVIGRAFPDAHCCKMRRSQCTNVPLVHRIIGKSVDADFAGAP